MNAHQRAQVLRFLRLTAAALVTLYTARGGRVDWATLWALLPGAVEAAVRQMRKVAPVSTADSAPPPTSAAL